nr:MAG TPA: hypothetical protein [Caudoviricetes sp.]
MLRILCILFVVNTRSMGSWQYLFSIRLSSDKIPGNAGLCSV